MGILYGTAIFIVILLTFMAAARLTKDAESEELTDVIRARARGGFVKLSKGYTHYEIAGPEYGPVVVLVHGFSVPLHMWDPTYEALTKTGFRVVRYDLYGRGLTDRPRVLYNRELFVEQLRELLDALAIREPVHLAGTSMGGAVVAAFAVDYPDRVEKIVLIDPLTRKFDIGPLALPGIGEFVAKAFYLPSLPEKQLEDFDQPCAFPEWSIRFREQMRYRGFGDALLSTARHFMNRDHDDDYRRLGRLGKNVILFWGEHDRTLDTCDASPLADLLGAELIWIQKAGHVPHYEQPWILNPLMIAFLSKNALCRPGHGCTEGKAG